MYKETFPIWKPSPNRTSIGFSQCLSHNSPARGWPYRFQEERLDLPYCTMILTTCVVVDESKCLDIPIWEFSIILEHFPFFLGISTYCISCLSCAPWQSGDDIHDFCCRHLWCWWSLFCKYCIRSRVIFHDVVSGVLLDNSNFWCFCLQFSIFQMTDVLAPFLLASSITSFLLLTFVRFLAENFFNFSHSLSTAAFVNTIHPAPEIHEHFMIHKGHGTLCTTSSTLSPTLRPLWPIVWTTWLTQTRWPRSTEHTARRL